MQVTWIAAILFAIGPISPVDGSPPTHTVQQHSDAVVVAARRKKKRRNKTKKPRNRRRRAVVAPQPAPQPEPTAVEPQPQPQTEPELTKVAVLELGVDGDADPGLARQLSNRLAEVLGKKASFEVITPDDVRNLLELEELKQLLGCDDQSCLVELAGAVGADGVVRGRLARLPNGHGVMLTATNTRTALNIARVNETWGGEPEGLLELVEPMVDELLAGDTEPRGTLTVEGTHQGSRIVIDGQLRGSHPKVTFDVPIGARSVEILTDGHEPVLRWVVVRVDQPARVAVQLREESDPFYATWWFWTATAVGVAGLTAGGIYWRTSRDGANTGVNISVNAAEVMLGVRR